MTEQHEGQPLMIDAEAVAKLLSVSNRTVFRLRDAGKMPAPVKLGSRTVWRREAIEQWVAEGCPAIRS